MRQFGGFNVDLVKIAAVDCLYRTNFYFGLIVVIAVPVAGVIFIFLLHRFGKAVYLSRLKRMPRKCVRSGELVMDWMPYKEYIKLRRESAKKSLQADAIPDDDQNVDVNTTKGRKEHARALKQQMGNLTGLPPGSSIGLKFFNQPGIIDENHLQEVLDYNENIWKKKLVERMEYMRYTNKCWKLLFWMMLLGYPSVAVKTLRTYSCIQVGSYRVLSTDMGIECTGLTYLSSTATAAAAATVFCSYAPLPGTSLAAWLPTSGTSRRHTMVAVAVRCSN